MSGDAIKGWSGVLRQVGPRHWTAPGDSSEDVSYPPLGHLTTEGLEDTSFWFAHRSSCIEAVVGRFPPAGPVLDVGGGTGVVAAALCRLGHEMVVLEPTHAGVEASLRRGSFDVIEARFEDVGFKPGSVPAMSMFDVLEHIDDDVGFLRATRSAISDGGIVYVTVPAHQLLWSVDDSVAGHHRRYSLASLRSALAAAGFRVLFDTYFFSFLPPAILLLRSLPSRLGLLNESTDRAKREHTLPGGAVGDILAALMDREVGRIREGRISFGASILMVAKPAESTR